MNRIYKGVPIQNGYGLGGTFKRFFNWLVPLIQKHAVPVIKSSATEVGKKALETAADIAKDVVAGKNFKEASEERINTSVETLKRKIEDKLEGRGAKKRKFLIKKHNKKVYNTLENFFKK